MTNPKTRHDELKAPIDHRANAERALSTIDASNDPRNLPAGLDGIGSALLALHDLLRERLPESPNHTSGGPYTCMGCGTELYAGDPLDCGKHGEPAPADDLPGEPVEPGDLRAGDRVAFTWGSENQRITGVLVSDQDGDRLRSDVPDSKGYAPNVVFRGDWDFGISDVRLIERAPREDEDRDEALAKVICDADMTDYSGWDELNGLGMDSYRRMARAAREHLIGGQSDGR